MSAISFLLHKEAYTVTFSLCNKNYIVWSKMYYYFIICRLCQLKIVEAIYSVWVSNLVFIVSNPKYPFIFSVLASDILAKIKKIIVSYIKILDIFNIHICATFLPFETRSSSIYLVIVVMLQKMPALFCYSTLMFVDLCAALLTSETKSWSTCP